MVNCNPETVSTDYDTSDRLYFEPLTAEDVIELVEVERRNGELLGLIVQFGGQTPLKLAKPLEAAGIPILGTSPDAIDLAEDRERFQKLLHKLEPAPARRTAPRPREAEAIKVAEKIGYPVVIRPSYVLGGRAMEIVHDLDGLQRYMRDAVKVSGDNPVLIDLSARRDRGRCRCAGRRTRTSSSPASWSISRRPASIPAIPPARCRPTRCRTRSSPRSSARPRRWPRRCRSSA